MEILKILVICAILFGIAAVFVGMVYGVDASDKENSRGVMMATRAILAGGLISGLGTFVVVVYVLYCMLQTIF